MIVKTTRTMACVESKFVSALRSESDPDLVKTLFDKACSIHLEDEFEMRTKNEYDFQSNKDICMVLDYMFSVTDKCRPVCCCNHAYGSPICQGLFPILNTMCSIPRQNSNTSNVGIL